MVRRRAVPQRLGSRKQELASPRAANTAASVKKTGAPEVRRAERNLFQVPELRRTQSRRAARHGGTPIKGVQSADIDESNDTIFTVEDGKEALGPAQVLQVSHLGQPILTFGSGTIHQATGIAVNSNNHKVYVTSDTPTPHIDIFKRNPTPVTVPDANTLPAAHPSGTTATLRAEIDPAGGGTTTDCRFDWGPETKYEFGTLPCKVGGSETNAISSPTEVTNGVSSLTLGNQYHYRVATRNANGHWSFGADQLFEASTPRPPRPCWSKRSTRTPGHFHTRRQPTRRHHQMAFRNRHARTAR